MKCPRCNKNVSSLPSLSRVDNETHICEECSGKEAMIEQKIFNSDKSLEELKRLSSEVKPLSLKWRHYTKIKSLLKLGLIYY